MNQLFNKNMRYLLTFLMVFSTLGATRPIFAANLNDLDSALDHQGELLLRQVAGEAQKTTQSQAQQETSQKVVVVTPPLQETRAQSLERIAKADTNTTRIKRTADSNKMSALDKPEYNLKSLEIIDMNILDVLKLISKKSGLNIVAGQNINGRVTTFLENTNVFDALHIILSSNNLAYAEERGVIRVMTSADYERLYGKKFGVYLESEMFSLRGVKASRVEELIKGMLTKEGKAIADETSNTIFVEDTPEKLDQIADFIESIDSTVVTEVFNLDYAVAKDISENIGTKLTPGIGEIMIDERSNALVIKDFAHNLLKVEPLIMQLDRKEEEVLIEAKIIQVTLEDDFVMGVDWETLHSEITDLGFQGDFKVLGGAASDVTKGSVSVGDLSDDKFTAFIEVLQTMGRTRVLSNPRISAVNNKEAKILVGTTKPYITSTTTTTTSGPTVSEEVNFIDVGVKLYVTPTIHSDNYITMIIRPEVSTAALTIVSAEGNEIPIVDTSEVETTIRVKDRATIILGGLIKEETTLSENKVPLLGDIPVLGKVFSSTKDESTKTEIVILLTPRIIDGHDQPEIGKIVENLENAPIDEINLRHNQH